MNVGLWRKLLAVIQAIFSGFSFHLFYLFVVYFGGQTNYAFDCDLFSYNFCFVFILVNK